MSTLRTLSLIALFFAATTLAGCGGGGSTPSEDGHNEKGTTSMYVQNDTGFNGRLEIGGASFPISGHGFMTLNKLTVGHTYSWRFVSSWSTRSGRKTISGISSNSLFIR